MKLSRGQLTLALSLLSRGCLPLQKKSPFLHRALSCNPVSSFLLGKPTFPVHMSYPGIYPLPSQSRLQISWTLPLHVILLPGRWWMVPQSVFLWCLWARVWVEAVSRVFPSLQFFSGHTHWHISQWPHILFPGGSKTLLEISVHENLLLKVVMCFLLSSASRPGSETTDI